MVDPLKGMLAIPHPPLKDKNVSWRNIGTDLYYQMLSY